MIEHKRWGKKTVNHVGVLMSKDTLDTVFTIKFLIYCLGIVSLLMDVY